MNGSDESTEHSFLSSLFGNLKLVVCVPFVFVRAPFRFYRLAQQRLAPKESVTFYIEALIFQISMTAVLTGINQTANPESISLHSYFGFISAPVVQLIAVLVNYLIVIGTSLPAISYLARKSSNLNAKHELTSFVFYFVGIFALLKLLEAPALIFFSDRLFSDPLTPNLVIAISVVVLCCFSIIFVKNIQKIAVGISFFRISIGAGIWFILYILAILLGGAVVSFMVTSFIGR